MPYISQDRRRDLDEAIDCLKSCFMEGAHANSGKIAGDMHYMFSRLLEVVPVDEVWSYKAYNMVIGVLECMKQELARRLYSLIEDDAIFRNGDIPIYEGLHADFACKRAKAPPKTNMASLLVRSQEDLTGITLKAVESVMNHDQ